VTILIRNTPRNGYMNKNGDYPLVSMTTLETRRGVSDILRIVKIIAKHRMAG
jgi:hypothetical protein